MRQRKNFAMQEAKIYRDKCTRLETDCYRLMEERHLCRNKVLERQSRGGKWNFYKYSFRAIGLFKFYFHLTHSTAVTDSFLPTFKLNSRFFLQANRLIQF